MFRAWDKDKKEMSFFGLYSLLVDGIEHDRDWQRHFEAGMRDLEVMQFTGVKDENDREICEGDILRISGKPPHSDIVFLRKVSFHPLAPACGFVLGDADQDYIEHFGRIMKDDDTDWDVEVIGNIYENPELLKAYKS